jgi:16S rRNA (guanine966-N2)-methyltransferase
MRITGGRLRGRRIGSPSGPGVRPTSSKVREALFSMLGQSLDGWSMLDGFGGSGLMAFEAASRGAGPVTVVEKNRRAARAIQSSARALGVELDVSIADTRAVLRQGGRWDFVFLDPPYREDPAVWVALAAGAARHVLVVEHQAHRAVPDAAGSLLLDRQRRYGESALSVYRPGPNAVVDQSEVVAQDLAVVEGEAEAVEGG